MTDTETVDDAFEGMKDALSAEPTGIKKLAETAGVSVSDARTALDKLVEDGFAQKVPNRGYATAGAAEDPTPAGDEDPGTEGGEPPEEPDTNGDGEGPVPAVVNRRSAVGEHDTRVFEILSAVENPPEAGWTIAEIATLSNLRVRVATNVTWRLDTKAGLLEEHRDGRVKRYKIKPQAEAEAEANA